MTTPAFAFDPGEITLDELEVLSEHGVNLMDLTPDEAGEVPESALSAKLLRGLVFVVQRRQNDTFTWADAGRFSINEMTDLLADAGGLVDDPTEPSD